MRIRSRRSPSPQRPCTARSVASIRAWGPNDTSITLRFTNSPGVARTELPRGAFRGLGRKQRMRMHLFQREMAVDEPHCTGKAFEQVLEERRRLLAGGTFEIAVLDDRHCGAGRAEHVLDLADRNHQVVVGSVMHVPPERVLVMFSAALRVRGASLVRRTKV